MTLLVKFQFGAFCTCASGVHPSSSMKCVCAMHCMELYAGTIVSVYCRQTNRSGADHRTPAECRIDWDSRDLPGAERVMVVDLQHCECLPPGTVPLRASRVIEWSPHNPEE
jgi:hypothetical protein